MFVYKLYWTILSRTINTLAQQTALDNALVSPGDRVKIGKSNIRIIPTIMQKEPTYQVVLDALALTPCYPAFQITAEVPEIYMHPFWRTITKIKDSSSYQFKLDKKKCKVDVEVFRDILQICPRLTNQEFVEPPTSDEEIVSFIKELSYKGDIESVNEVFTDHMHQPWRTFAAIINRYLFGKTTGLDKIRLSRAQIMWGMFYNKNVNYFELLWEDFMFQIDNKNTSAARKENMPIQDLQRLLSITSFLKIKPTKKPAKKPAARRQSAGVQIRDTSGMSVSKKKTPAKAERNKGIDLMFEAALLEEAQIKNEYEYWGVSNDDDQQGDDERTKSDDDKSVDLNKTNDEEETQEDEFVNTPDDYVPTDDEIDDVDDEEYGRINKEMYDDVNVELKDAEPADEGKGDEEMADAKKVNAEHDEVNQEDASAQVQDEAQETTTAAPAQIASSSRSVSSNYVQHENPSIHSSSLLTVPVLVISEPTVLLSIPENVTAAPATTILPPIPPFIPYS
ncbi:hypothetical protein Tco_0910426 [Tanacetum coccineum]|uniref:Uncharacterized protein n=1 Tax=Tanacetum coccineum TaxID=301880 RepID=A0ABQ5CW47_9ASTR